MQTVFTNKELQQSFENEGFLVLKSLAKNVTNKMLQFYDETHIDMIDGFSTTQAQKDFTLKKKTSEFIIQNLSQILKKLVTDFEPIVGNFAIKTVGGNSELPFHQDWSIVDESIYSYINVWCSLEKITKRNGALRIIPKSHLLQKFKRSVGISNPYQELFKELEGCAITIETDPGDIVVWEGSLVHGSWPNLGSKTRIATILIAKPKLATPYFYFKNDKRESIDEFGINSSFFYSYELGSKPNLNATFQRSIAPNNIDFEELKKDIFSIKKRTTNKLGDLTNDQSVLKNGFCYLSSLKIDEIKQLVDLYNEFDDSNSEGFYTSLNLLGNSQKDKLFSVIQTIYDKSFSALLPGYEVLMCNYVVKKPGKNSYLPLHLDWSVVDDTKYKSYGIWIPLQAVKEIDGPLGLLEGSHEFGLTIRGSKINFLAHNEIIPPGYDGTLEYMAKNYKSRVVDLEAGQPVLYDLRVAHFSNANLSNKTRVAVNVIVIPKGAEIVHYMIDDLNNIKELKVGKNFYRDLDLSKHPSEWEICGDSSSVKNLKYIEEQFGTTVLI